MYRGNRLLHRFTCLDAHDQAGSTDEIEARSLIDAIAKAHMMLKSRPHYQTVEVLDREQACLSCPQGSHSSGVVGSRRYIGAAKGRAEVPLIPACATQSPPQRQQSPT